MKFSLKTPEVLIAGDVCPAAITSEDLMTRLQLTVRPDLFMWTLDAALPAGPPRQDATCMPFQASALNGLGIGEITMVVTASNHLTDFGSPGMAATLQELDNRGFRHVGAGFNQSQANETAYIDLPAGRAALLAYAEIHPRVGAVAASGADAGVRGLELEACLQAIRDAKKQADWVWIVLHWGEEFVRFPDPEQRHMAWQMVDAGASLVVAAHTHVPLGFERRGESTIFYGLGNFIFPPYQEARGYQYRWHPAARQGVVVAGSFAQGHWIWEPREICLCHSGLPRIEKHKNCPDYGRTLSSQLSEYSRAFPLLRSRERAQFLVERACSMSGQERMFRLRQLIRKLPGLGR